MDTTHGYCTFILSTDEGMKFDLCPILFPFMWLLRTSIWTLKVLQGCHLLSAKHFFLFSIIKVIQFLNGIAQYVIICVLSSCVEFLCCTGPWIESASNTLWALIEFFDLIKFNLKDLKTCSLRGAAKLSTLEPLPQASLFLLLFFETASKLGKMITPWPSNWIIVWVA